MANLDRFSHGEPDSQNAPIVAYCECGGEIYEEGYDRCLECEELGEIPFDDEEEEL